MTTEMLGQHYGRLRVLSVCEDDKRYLMCLCQCGIEKRIRRDHVRAGRTISCGCESRRLSRERILNRKVPIGLKHGASRSRAYSTWLSMKQRCLNPNFRHYHRYGGRGIAICERWLSFENFLADMGQPPDGGTIDRIDNDGNYEPGNCRWATRSVQASNRSVNKLVTWNGKTLNLSQWARETGIHRNTLEQRLDAGPSLESVFSPEKHRDLSGLALGGAANGKRLAELTHCKWGHPFDSVNSYWNGRQRVCRACRRVPARRK